MSPEEAAANPAKEWQRGHWMQTITGRAFYPLAPRLEDINPTDIAHALGMQCRYNGHVKRFYSVAEHCVLMSDWIMANRERPRYSRELALWALLHDAAEAYIGDMVRPLKRDMPEYCAIDDRLTSLIAERFGLGAGQSLPDEVRMIDTRILLDERAALLATPPQSWGHDDLLPLGVKIHGWDPATARWEYTARLDELTAHLTTGVAS